MDFSWGAFIGGAAGAFAALIVIALLNGTKR